MLPQYIYTFTKTTHPTCVFVKHTELGISEQIWKHLWIVPTENKKGKVEGELGRGGTAIWSDSETNLSF